MRRAKHLIWILSLLVHCASLAQVKPALPTPPNGVWMRDSLFMDKTEIANVGWLEYLHYQRKDSSRAIYENALPDTLAWLAFHDTTRMNNYLRSPAHRAFPAVGMTYEQAVNFCKWRSDAVNQLYANPDKRKELKIKKGDRVVFTFRLPTENEWIEAASGSLDIKKYPYGYVAYDASPQFKEKASFYYEKTNKAVSYDVFKTEWKAYLKNKGGSIFNTMKMFKDYFEYGDYAPRSVYDYRTRANPTGVYDMVGNVAEIVQQKGFAKGGSWAHSLDGSKVNRVQLYNKPEAWLGFRCVCEVSLRKE